MDTVTHAPPRAFNGTGDRLRGLVRGRTADPAWVRPALLAVLIGAAVLYIWGLDRSGWANSYYSAAVLAGAIVGLAFLTKYLQAYMVLPAFVLTFFLLGPGTWPRRTWQLLAAGGALLASSGWWVAVVSAIPATSRPFIGGSTNNTVLDL